MKNKGTSSGRLLLFRHVTGPALDPGDGERKFKVDEATVIKAVRAWFRRNRKGRPGASPR